MLGLADTNLIERRELVDKVLGGGLTDAQRARWRFLTGIILAVLQRAAARRAANGAGSSEQSPRLLSR